jgi:hypothetical protein
MKRYVEAEDRSQSTLFLKRLDDYIAEDNPVREICFHPIRTDPPKSPPETGASPADQDLAQPSVLGRAAPDADSNPASPKSCPASESTRRRVAVRAGTGHRQKLPSTSDKAQLIYDPANRLLRSMGKSQGPV